MSGFVFPVYVRAKDDGSVMEFPTQAAIEQHLEAIDVENAEYEAWDATGRCLELSARKTRREWLKIVPAEGRADAREFEEIKASAERRREYAYTPLSKRLLNWLGLDAKARS